MNPRTAEKWILADQYCRTHPVPSVLAQVAAQKAKVAMRKAVPAKPAIRVRRGFKVGSVGHAASKVKTPQQLKKDLKKELEALCKAIVFTRDCGSTEAREGNCISCGRWHVLQWGHFITQRDSKWLQYDPRNTGAQCRQCNMNGGNVLKYAQAIDKRDGAGAAEALQKEAEARDPFWRPNKTTLGVMLAKLQKHPLAPAAKPSISHPNPPNPNQGI